MPKLTFDYETLKLQFDAEVNLWELTHNHFIVWRGLGEALSEGRGLMAQDAKCSILTQKIYLHMNGRKRCNRKTNRHEHIYFEEGTIIAQYFQQQL
jgi:hypothetical protein